MSSLDFPEQRAAGLKAVLIYGPTASGKSAFALELAREFDGVVINADSMQVYGELRVLTSRPSPVDETLAPHRLYGTRGAKNAYSAALWLEDVKEVLAEAARRNWLPIVVGGTGLYFKALTEGLSAIPAIPDDIRSHYRSLAQSVPADALYGELLRRDPLTAARLRPSDPQRLIRALEVIEATGRPLASWQAERDPPLLPLKSAYALAVTMDRDELYSRCEARFDSMLAVGALEEARIVDAMGLDPALPIMRAVGLAQLLAQIRGELPLEEAIAAAKTATRNYAKRQLTWIRGNFELWKQYNTQYLERTKHEIAMLLEKRLTART
jgi:tRNA dimethylallyltransferase